MVPKWDARSTFGAASDAASTYREVGLRAGSAVPTVHACERVQNAVGFKPVWDHGMHGVGAATLNPRLQAAFLAVALALAQLLWANHEAKAAAHDATKVCDLGPALANIGNALVDIAPRSRFRTSRSSPIGRPDDRRSASRRTGGTHARRHAIAPDPLVW